MGWPFFILSLVRVSADDDINLGRNIYSAHWLLNPSTLASWCVKYQISRSFRHLVHTLLAISSCPTRGSMLACTLWLYFLHLHDLQLFCTTFVPFLESAVSNGTNIIIYATFKSAQNSNTTLLLEFDDCWYKDTLIVDCGQWGSQCAQICLLGYVVIHPKYLSCRPHFQKRYKNNC